MSISELASAFTSTTGAQIAVVVFFAIFAVLVARLYTRAGRAAALEASTLPLADDELPNPTTRASAAALTGDDR